MVHLRVVILYAPGLIPSARSGDVAVGSPFPPLCVAGTSTPLLSREPSTQHSCPPEPSISVGAHANTRPSSAQVPTRATTKVMDGTLGVSLVGHDFTPGMLSSR